MMISIPIPHFLGLPIFSVSRCYQLIYIPSCNCDEIEPTFQYTGIAGQHRKMTLLGALTPTARPLSCSTDTNLYGIEFATGARYGILGPIDTQACMPPGYIAEMSDYYYPASVCPYGYTVACDPIPVTVVQDNAVVTQIAYTCCPT